MYGPTCIFWANLTPFSLKSAQEREQAGTRGGSDDTSFLAELNKFIAKGGAEVSSIRCSWVGARRRLRCLSHHLNRHRNILARATSPRRRMLPPVDARGSLAH
jgi:hypothetical protein